MSSLDLQFPASLLSKRNERQLFLRANAFEWAGGRSHFNLGDLASGHGAKSYLLDTCRICGSLSDMVCTTISGRMLGGNSEFTDGCLDSDRSTDLVET